MANNFRKIGNYYISKTGSDANSGTDPNLPKSNIYNNNGSIIIGSGFYIAGFSYDSYGHTPPGTTFKLFGDGNVIINSNGGVNNVLQGTAEFYNLTLQNFDNSTNNSINAVLGPSTMTFNDCVIKNCVFNGSAWQTLIFNNCTLINCDFSLITAGATQFNGSTTINSLIVNCNQFISSYANAGTSINTTNSIINTNFDYNNINGKIMMPFGASSGQSLTFAQHRTAYSTYNIHSFDLDPQFNNIIKSDFSYGINSPNISKSQGGVLNIGSTNYGKGLYSISSNELNPANGAVVNNLVLNGNDYILSGATSGSVITTPIAIASYVAEVQKINYLGYLFFDKSFSGGTDNNSNVPDYSTYLSGDTSGGSNPDRLGYRMRWSTKLTIPVINSDWDNGGLVTTGVMTEFEWGQKPLIDNLGRGNGTTTFNRVTGGSIGARWIQIEVTLRNNYNN